MVGLPRAEWMSFVSLGTRLRAHRAAPVKPGLGGVLWVVSASDRAFAEPVLVGIDEGDYQGRRGSSSSAKRLDAGNRNSPTYRSHTVQHEPGPHTHGEDGDDRSVGGTAVGPQQLSARLSGRDQDFRAIGVSL